MTQKAFTVDKTKLDNPAAATPAPGETWTLAAKPEIGSREVLVEAVEGDKITAAFGRFGDNQQFLKRTYNAKEKGGDPVRRATFTRSDFAAYINTQTETGDTNMAKKDANADAAGVTPAQAAKRGGKKAAAAAQGQPGSVLSDEEKAAALQRAEAEKEKAEREKAAAKAKRAAEARETKLKEVGEKAGLKEADVAAQFSADRKDDAGAVAPPVKKYVQLTEEEAGKAMEHLKAAAKQKAKDDALAKSKALTPEEAADRKDLEKIVDKNLDNFQQAAFQIGGALTGINQKRLYRSTHESFEDYVLERFGLSRPHAYSVMGAAATFSALTEGQVVDAKNLPSITAAEAITRGVKGLLKAGGLEENPEVDAITRQLARNAYQIAVQDAPKDKAGQPILSPAHLQNVFGVLNEVAKSGVVELDGKQMPINLAAQSVDEMITTKSAEQVARLKQSIADRVAKQRETAAAGRAAVGAAVATATGNGMAIPEGTKPRITVACSVHGRVPIEGTSDNDINLGCGCIFVSTPEGYVFDKNVPPAKKAPAAPAAPAA